MTKSRGTLRGCRAVRFSKYLLLQEEGNLGSESEAFTCLTLQSHLAVGQPYPSLIWEIWPRGRNLPLGGFYPAGKTKSNTLGIGRVSLLWLKRLLFTFVFAIQKNQTSRYSLQILGITFYCGKLLYRQRAMLVCVCVFFLLPLELGSYPGLNASSSYLYFPRLTV